MSRTIWRNLCPQGEEPLAEAGNAGDGQIEAETTERINMATTNNMVYIYICVYSYMDIYIYNMYVLGYTNQHGIYDDQ